MVKYNTSTSLRISKDQRRKAAAIARRRKMSLSDLVRSLVQECIDADTTAKVSQ